MKKRKFIRKNFIFYVAIKLKNFLIGNKGYGSAY